MKLMECSLGPHTNAIVFSPEAIIGLQRQQACARGLCHDQCYQLLKGKNAKKHAKNYLKKHGTYPLGYVSTLNQTDTNATSSLTEVFSEPLRTVRIQHRDHQSHMNP